MALSGKHQTAQPTHRARIASEPTPQKNSKGRVKNPSPRKSKPRLLRLALGR